MSDIFFSIIVCTYNRAHLIENALSSILKQTEKSYEIIIVDDGSTDKTLEIAKKYCDLEQNCRYIHQFHSGVSSARNSGINIASGKYITFLDSDDEYEPDHLLLRKEVIVKNNFPDLVYGGVKIVGNPFVPDKNNTDELIHLDKCIIGGTFFIKRSILNEINGFDIVDFAEDSVFFEKVLKKGYKVLKVNYPTYIYHREYDDSICNILKNGKELYEESNQ